MWGPKRTTIFTRWCGGSRREETADGVQERAGVDIGPQRQVEAEPTCTKTADQGMNFYTSIYGNISFVCLLHLFACMCL